MAVYGPRDPGYAYQQYTPLHIQNLQRWEDKTNETIMILEANVDIVSSLRRFYTELKSSGDFPQELQNKCDVDIVVFANQIDDMLSDFRMQIARAKLLVKITNDRKELVSA